MLRVVNIKVSSIADKVSPIRFMARNVDIKLPILCDGQGQTTLGGLILRTQCGAQRMFYQPPLLMRVALQGSQV